ncbi:PLD nuclease N-terminal domain-containing protein [Marinifilum caeruleilacunae]|uniref:PLDc_N domain-containing protein n=1 Tax=Marinifilum caeruleilacunae TaxID=2499076 RepID=A0ABX1X1V8_9BACT|nr:PLD nuclease N-terminal domain-containing protein [Marinifilum caeruleilacunae]NOU62211.1 PLDc_N domain-containing protein [Marinifilum caeruleilacunae]
MFTLCGIIGPWQILILGLFILLPLIVLIDILRNEFTGNNKLIWILVVLIFPFLGTLLYLIIGTKQKIKNQQL